MTENYSMTLKTDLASKGIHENQYCDSVHALKNLKALNSAMAREVAAFQGQEHFDLKEYARDLQNIAAEHHLQECESLKNFCAGHEKLMKRINDLTLRTAGEEECRSFTEKWHSEHPEVHILYDIYLEKDGMKTTIPQVILSRTGIYAIGHGSYSKEAVLNADGILTSGKKRSNIAAVNSYREKIMRGILPEGSALPFMNIFCIVSHTRLKDLRRKSDGRVRVILADKGTEQLDRLISGPAKLNTEELKQIEKVLREESNAMKRRTLNEDAVLCESIKTAFTELMDEIQNGKKKQEQPKTFANRMLSFFRTAFAAL